MCAVCVFVEFHLMKRCLQYRAGILFHLIVNLSTRDHHFDPALKNARQSSGTHQMGEANGYDMCRNSGNNLGYDRARWWYTM